jgi:hypothetical protein
MKTKKALLCILSASALGVQFLTPALRATSTASEKLVAAQIPLDGASISTDLLDASLSQWEVFMGVPHSSVTGLPKGTFQSGDVTNGTPLGLNNDPKKVFTTFVEDGTTVLHITGEIYGGLTTKKEYADHHFETDFKWGERKWEPRTNKVRDSGILYHCHGEHGAFWKVWKSCLEFQVQEKDSGGPNPNPALGKKVIVPSSTPSQPLPGRTGRAISQRPPNLIGRMANGIIWRFMSSAIPPFMSPMASLS